MAEILVLEPNVFIEPARSFFFMLEILHVFFQLGALPQGLHDGPYC